MLSTSEHIDKERALPFHVVTHIEWTIKQNGKFSWTKRKPWLFHAKAIEKK